VPDFVYGLMAFVVVLAVLLWAQPPADAALMYGLMLTAIGGGWLIARALKSAEEDE